MADIAQVRVNNTDYNFADDTKVPYDLLQDTVGFTSKNFFDESLIQVGIAWNGNTNADRARAIIPCQPSTKYILTMNGTNNLDSLGFILPSGSYTTITFPQTITTGANDSIITFGFNKTAIALANVTVLKLMLRKADIMDDTYEPYHESVEQSKFDRAEQAVLGAKNLLETTASTTTVNGITFTVNADGSVTANGTATADAYFGVLAETKAFATGRYILNGSPVGSARNSNYVMKIQQKPDNIYQYYDEGNGVEFDLVDSNLNQVYVVVFNGTTVSNLTFKPMLRLASDPDDTYVPYAMTNRELTEIVQDLLTRVEALES